MNNVTKTEDQNRIRDIVEQRQGQATTGPQHAKNQLGKEEFLKIMLAQMKNQDPTKPLDSKEMASQLAQFSSIEQLVNLNKGMDTLSQKQDPNTKLMLGSLIGKTVDVETGRVFHTQGAKDQLSISVPKDTAKVKVMVLNAEGDLVKEWEETPLKDGTLQVTWDGQSDKHQAAKSGEYVFKFTASTPEGKSLSVSTASRGKIVGVDFSGKDPVLVLDNKNKVAFSQVKSIQEGGSGEPAKN